MQFNKTYKILFLDPNSESVDVNEKLHVVLSPSLYWVKKLSLPITKLGEVKKLLPSIFEDVLPEGKYSFFVYKSPSDSDFFAFAYEDKKILDILNKKNISISNVQSVHFAQSELMNIEGAVKINKTQSLYIKDDILVLVPCCWIEEKSNLHVENLKLSKHKINLTQFGHIVDTKSLYKIGGILLVLLLLMMSELFINSIKTQNILDAKDELFEKNGLKPTMFQNKALLDKFENLHVEQTSLRNAISAILELRLQAGEHITLLNLKNKTLVANFKIINQQSTSKIQKALKQKNIKFSMKTEDKNLHVEIKL